jgi:hypothetical protein
MTHTQPVINAVPMKYMATRHALDQWHCLKVLQTDKATLLIMKILHIEVHHFSFLQIRNRRKSRWDCNFVLTTSRFSLNYLQICYLSSELIANEATQSENSEKSSS